MEKRKCTTCNKTMSIDKFSLAYGHPTHRCRACHSAYVCMRQKLQIAARKPEGFRKCKACGEYFNLGGPIKKYDIKKVETCKYCGSKSLMKVTVEYYKAKKNA